MPSRLPTLSLLGQAWAFYRKNAVFNAILLWLAVIPLTAVQVLGPLLAPEEPRLKLAFDIALLVFQVFLLAWSSAAVLLVGKRMIQNRAGRSRTSLRSVVQESAPSVLPLLLTGLLRACIVLQYSLLFILPAIAVVLAPGLCGGIFASVPGTGGVALMKTLSRCTALPLLLPLLVPAFVYGVRTAFYAVALVVDDAPYREALRRSTDFARGRFWETLCLLLVPALLLLVPSEILGVASVRMLVLIDPQWEPVGVLLATAVTEFAALLYALTLVAAYGRLRGRKAADAVHALQGD